MNSEQNPLGVFNFNAQGNVNSPVDVNILLGKSYEYNNLLDQLNTQQKLFDRTPEAETTERLEISKKINNLKDLIEQFKRDVLQLAEQFNRIEINSDRLNRAKEFFDKGEFGEARAVLQTELEQMQDEQSHLLRQREHYETEVLPNLINNSQEFFILALSTQSDYTNPNYYQDTRDYFERSIKSHTDKSNVFQYAVFLQEHNQFAEAEKYYLQCLDDFAHQLSQDERATTLNNLAILHSNQNNYEEALKEYEEALQIYRSLDDINPNTYLSDVAMTLNNLAILHSNQNNYEEALEEFEEALQIYRNLTEINPNAYLPYVATTLNNLGLLHSNQNNYEEALKEYEEALQIRRNLAEINPNTYLPNVAKTLNNFAGLHFAKDELEEVLQKSEESTEIYRELVVTNFQAYFPYLSVNLSNLALFYQVKIQQREKSITYAIEAITILFPYLEQVPFTREHFARALNVLENWNLSDEEIWRLVEEKRKETGENRA
ncbi:MAG: tetratricopeptide repeat protein [Acidobacteriota bacterium]|nr:tetratricopeptide repeat protein [Acidobacteriota bacterium]